jgi:hypothetical protein
LKARFRRAFFFDDIAGRARASDFGCAGCDFRHFYFGRLLFGAAAPA